MKINLQERVFYEIYPLSFADSNGDGFGDLQGIIKHLDYLVEVGFNGIWLNPMFKSPFKDGGYDVSDFFAVDPRFGTMDDFKELVSECHKRDIVLLLDLVAGHASYLNPDFLKSAEGTMNEKSDLFVWNDCPWVLENGYRMVSGMYDRAACYMVNFFAHQPAINYGFAKIEYPWQEKVGAKGPEKGLHYLEKIINFWLELGADGYRVDMADSLVKNDHDKVETIKLWQRIFKDTHAIYPDSVFVSEWSNPKQSLRAGFDMDFVLDHENNFSHYLLRYTRDGHSPLIVKPDEETNLLFKADLLDRLSTASVYEKDLALITGNHDTRRLGTYLNDLELKIALTYIMTLPGVPFVYAGDEIHATHIDDLPSFEGAFQRTGCRLPQKWDNSKNNGFSQASKLYLEINKKDPTVEDSLKDPSSPLNCLKKLIEIKKTKTDFQDGDFEFIDEYSYRRSNSYVLINLEDSDLSYPDIDGKIILEIGKVTCKDKNIVLHGKSVVIVEFN